MSKFFVRRSVPIQVNKNYNNFKHAVKRIDEFSLNARGEERSQALARWLGALKDLDRDSKRGQEKSGREDGGPGGTEESEEDSAQQQSRVAMVPKLLLILCKSCGSRLPHAHQCCTFLQSRFKTVPSCLLNVCLSDLTVRFGDRDLKI